MVPSFFIMSERRKILFTTLKVIAFLAGATILACLLYPLAWRAMTTGTNWDYGPDRVFRRVWMLVIVTGLIVCRKPLACAIPRGWGFRSHGRDCATWAWASRWCSCF